MRYLFVPVILAVLLSACGYKGPLYLPAQPHPQQTKHDASQPKQNASQPRQDASQP